MTDISTHHKRPRLLAVILLSVLGLIFLTVIGFVGWSLVPSSATSIAVAALTSDETVSVIDSGWLEFSPRHSASLSSGSASLSESSTTLSEITEIANNDRARGVDKPGIIIYPGLHIDYHAYAPLAHEFAKAGYLTIIVSMPLSTAMLNPNAAQSVLKAYPSVQQWVICGHSMGGTAAAAFVEYFKGQRDTSVSLAGLVLWGSIVMSDLSQLKNLSVLSISADHDGNSPPAVILKNRSKLPASSQFAVIKGGNHAQFGCYGEQFGDNPATISPEEQRKQTVALTLDFLNKLVLGQ